MIDFHDLKIRFFLFSEVVELFKRAVFMFSLLFCGRFLYMIAGINYYFSVFLGWKKPHLQCETLKTQCYE